MAEIVLSVEAEGRYNEKCEKHFFGERNVMERKVNMAGVNPYKDFGKDEEGKKAAKELQEKISAENRSGWLYSDSIGDEEGKKKYHEAEEQNRAHFDEYADTATVYDPGTGTWSEIDFEPKFNTGGNDRGVIVRGEDGLRRREFSYDVNKDPLYKQYLAKYKRNGEDVMTDTLAKSAAMTGGMVSSYGVSAAAGAYNDYMQGANDIIPELHNIAYQKYQDELSRDREIYQLDEAKRQENATVNTVLQNYQYYGMPLTPEEKNVLYNAGYYIEFGPDGETIVDPSGNRIVAGNKYKDEQVESALTGYMMGSALSNEGINILLDAGYTYENGVLYSPDGQKVERSYMTQSDEMPADLMAAYSALVLANKTGKQLSSEYNKVLAEYGFIYDAKSNSYVLKTTGQPISDFFEVAGVTPGAEEEEEDKPPKKPEGDGPTGEEEDEKYLGLEGINLEMLKGYIERNPEKGVGVIDILVEDGIISEDEAALLASEYPELLKYA